MLSIVTIMTMIPALTEACVKERVIDSLESPTFEGLQFGPMGRYERLVGHFKGYTIVWRRSVQSVHGLLKRNWAFLKGCPGTTSEQGRYVQVRWETCAGSDFHPIIDPANRYESSGLDSHLKGTRVAVDGTQRVSVPRGMGPLNG